MPARDIYHDALKNALIKEQWEITHDPYHMKFGGFDFFIDLGAKSLIAARKEGEYIAVEIKSFVGASSLSEFHITVGQFLNYQIVLKEKEPNRKLYIGINEYIYETFFETTFGKLAIESHKLKLIVFDETEEVIKKWIT